jgi:hypothetical protein
MPQLKPKNVVLILTRDLADHIATPTFIIDEAGTLVYFTEPAEPLLGSSYIQVGELTRDQWGTDWKPRDPETGESIPVEELPLSIAQMRREPAQGAMWITGVDGVDRLIEVVAMPLVGQGEEVFGAVAFFWESKRNTS